VAPMSLIRPTSATLIRIFSSNDTLPWVNETLFASAMVDALIEACSLQRMRQPFPHQFLIEINEKRIHDDF
jgi:hypothetical protein